MNPNIQGEVTLEFVRGGVKKGRPYLMVANGRKEVFVNLSKNIEVTDDMFDQYSEGDEITLDVTVKVGSDTVIVNNIIE